MVNEEIKSCPFCGCEDITLDSFPNTDYADAVHPPHLDAFKYVWAIGCYGCGAKVPNRYSKTLLIDRWNRRAENGK